MKRLSKYAFRRLLSASARFFSTVLSPILAPTFGAFLSLWTSVLCLLPGGTRVTVLVMILGITGILPLIAIGVLQHFGVITGKNLVRRQERHLPYLVGIACYVGATLYLRHIHSPEWFVMFMAGGAVACTICAAVNTVWKISAHMAGMGGLVALLFQIHVQGLSAFNLFWIINATILLAGVLGTSRMILRRHTIMQVLTGFAVGYAAVTIAIKYFS